ncbi:cytochrome protein [Lepidopterella palustris CBS 459.81]|uniref:Cytochrome protein n=1 Tax=Lepidopterella palustris CBS 459.81 TaxID=1314670 RepID=A0A8E2E8P9_9PEZI|nr:cytochrome protein [Lepidopterella palustris CBS 459.81]
MAHSTLTSIPSILLGNGIGGTVAIAVTVFIIILTVSIYFNDRPYSGFLKIGRDESTWRAKQRWLSSAKSLMNEGLQKTNFPFQVIANCGPLIILPPATMDEIRNDDRMTFKAWLKQHFFTTYPGFQGFIPAVENDVFVNSVRIGLTQSLGQITEILSSETSITLEELFPFSTEWLKIAVDYTVDFFTAAYVLRLCPPVLRPLVHWFLPQTRRLRASIKAARRLIEPELAARRLAQEEDRKAGKPVEKHVDALQWVQSAAEAKGLHCDPVYGQLNYTLGAVHTTSVTFVNILYDLMAHPEYIELLREEISRVFQEHGKWDKTALTKLKLMDSFMKESARLTPVTMLPVNRVAEETVTLSDGTVIPKGATLGVPTLRSVDPSVYQDPLKFDGHRFYNLSQQPGGATKYQFVSTSNDSIIFGHGKHACPGRFFASNEIKIILVHLLTKYELKFPEGTTDRPKPMEMGADLMPNPEMKILIRSRVDGVVNHSF